MTNRSRRATLGGILLAYGLVGIVLVAAAWTLVGASFGGLARLGEAVDDQRRALGRSLDATATLLADARIGTANVQASLSATVDSARQTSLMTRGLAAAMDQLASATAIPILGTLPFGGATDTLRGVVTQAAGLADSLDRTADALAQNSTDLASVREDLGRIQMQVDELRQQVEGAAGSDATQSLASAAGGLDAARLVLQGLLAWLALQAVAAVVIGVALLGTLRRREHPAPRDGPG